MATTFQKRQKEMKRIERRKIKEEKRAQRKTEKDEDPKSTSVDPALDPTIDWAHTNDMEPLE
ncbi:MAG TPA: hypothetical protein VK525_14970 [Candidatus Saccharimonadales bacterium]|jgi:hypothetical protein|nr:hypothetical protein [Candidatus Saccharimonadales bacterium]